MSGVRKQSFPPDLAALLVVIVWGVNFPFLKLAVSDFGLLPFAFLRFAAMIALGWLVLLLRPAGRIERKDWPRVAASGLLGTTLYISASLAGIYFTTAFNNALLIAAAPVFSIVLLWLFRVEAIGRWRAAGLVVSFLGIAIFVGAVTGGSLAGNLLNVAAAFFFAAYSVVNKPLVSRYPATVVTAWTLTLGAIPILAVTGPSLAGYDWGRLTAGDWALLAWSVTFPVYAAWTVWSWVQSRIGVARPAVFMYLVPVVAGALSWVLVGERFTVLKILGAAVVLAGVVISRRTAWPAVAPDRQATNAGLAANLNSDLSIR